jgi:heptosyltransferase-2
MFSSRCGENGKPREWNVQNYIDLGSRLAEYDDRIRIILTGTKLERSLCDNINEELQGITLNMAGECTLEESAALIERSKLMICSNTGILHVSACVGTRTIGLH